jgi:predicted small lipoprotein YifL
VTVRSAFLTLVLLGAVAGCGKKGPPLPPLRLEPQRIEDLTAAKEGDEVRLRFTVPSANTNKSQPADIVAVEVYGLTGKAEDPFGQPLSGEDFRRFGTLASRVEVEPPPEAESESDKRTSAPASGTSSGDGDPRPAQGEVVTLSERLGPKTREPFVHPRKRQSDAAVEKAKTDPTSTGLKPLWWPSVEELPARVYAAVGVNRQGDRSALSNRVAVPLLDAIAPPPKVLLSNVEKAVAVNWERPPDVRRKVQEAASPGLLPSRSIVETPAPTTYNVYRVTRESATSSPAAAGEPAGQVAPVNHAPIDGLGFYDPNIAFGEERCYTVRALRVFGNARVESGPSPVACFTPADTFPPAAPKNLSAVGSEGGVSLIWDGSTEPDVAGYLVLRGEVTPDGSAPVLARLMQDPIKETTYRDATAKPGVRYVYAVVAVDNATPPNVSPESNRVEEGAR